MEEILQKLDAHELKDETRFNGISDKLDKIIGNDLVHVQLSQTRHEEKLDLLMRVLWGVAGGIGAIFVAVVIAIIQAHIK